MLLFKNLACINILKILKNNNQNIFLYQIIAQLIYKKEINNLFY